MLKLDTHLNHLDQIAIVGPGLLGGSIGLALRQAGYTGQLIGVARRQRTLDVAVKRGCIDAGCTYLPQVARRADLVILATPLGTFEPLLAELAEHGREGLIITDVGSTKQQVCQAADRLLPPVMARRFVGSHPMAGRELHGPEHAAADLFDHAACVITPQPHTDPQARRMVEALWQSLGMRLIDMTPEEHDRAVARISHLPHAVAVLLVQLAASDGDALELASSGFRDTTRVASGDPQVWTDIFTTNREAMVQVLDLFMDELKAFRQAVAAGDADSLKQLQQNAKQRRDGWLAKQQQPCRSESR